MFDKIKQAFLARYQRIDPHHGLNGGSITHVPGLFYHFRSKNGRDGHLRLFKKPCKGILLAHWNQMNEEWARVTVWNLFGLATIAHVDAGQNDILKHTKKPGWHFRFAKITVKKEYRGFSIRWSTADPGYSF